MSVFSSRWGAAKWGSAHWAFPGTGGTKYTASFEADGVATFNIVKTHQDFNSAHLLAAGSSPSNTFLAHLHMNGQVIAQGICTVVMATHQKFVGAFQIDRRDFLWKRYLSGIAIDGFPKDWDGGQQYWKDGLASDWINSIPETVFFTGFKGKDFKYYYNGLQTDGLNQDGSQIYWQDGLAYDFLDTPLTNEATIIITGQATMSEATRQGFAARFNWTPAAVAQFGSTMTQVGRPTMAGKGSLTINKTNSAMLASFLMAGVAKVSFISGIGSVNITCIDTGSVGGGQPAPAISFLYDAPYSY